jgi:hypothetical protein
MKSKTYRSGKASFRAYMKECGNGFEVGFNCGTKTAFIGNFLHAWEANQWYSLMNREIRTFSRRYKVGKNCPVSWYTHFISSHLYKKYYTFLNKVFVKHNRTYAQAVTRDTRKYNRLNRNWTPSTKSAFLKAA